MASSVKFVFCKQNIERFQKRGFEAFTSKYPDEKIEIKECAGTDLCSLCLDVPFAIRNGAIVHAKDEHDLYWKLDSGMQFLTGKRLVDIPDAPPAPPKEPAAAKPAAAAAPKAVAAPKAETKADEAPKGVATEEATAKAAEAPKADAAPKAEETPKAEEAPKAAPAKATEEAPKAPADAKVEEEHAKVE